MKKEKRLLTLVSYGKDTYPKSLEDYQLTIQLGCPIVIMTKDMLPLLRKRCMKKKVDVKLVSFLSVERQLLTSVVKKINKEVPECNVTQLQGKIKLDFPRKKSLALKLQKYQDMLVSFYQRNMHAVEVKTRKGRRYSVSVQYKFNKLLRPEWE